MPMVTWISRDGEWQGEKPWPDLAAARQHAAWLATPEAARVLRYRPTNIRIEEHPERQGRMFVPAAARGARNPGNPAGETAPAPPPPWVIPAALRDELRAMVATLGGWIDAGQPVDPVLARRYGALLETLARQAGEVSRMIQT